MNITKVDCNTGLSGEEDKRITECPVFQKVFLNAPTAQQSCSLGLKSSKFELDDCSFVENRLIHLAQLIELNTSLNNFRKRHLFLIFSSYTDSVGATSKNFTVLPPNIARQLFSTEWLNHCQKSFQLLLNENNQNLTAKFTNSPISKIVGFILLVPEVKVTFAVEAFSQLEVAKSDLHYTDNSDKFKVYNALLWYF
jgi:hypothetical protein